MRLAHLILTHTNPAQLNRLVERLAHTDADFYIHVDLKADIAPFIEANKNNNVHFVIKRVLVNWAGYSMVQATLNGLKEILNSGKIYDYINLLSGQDYPIKSTAQIHSFLEANPGKVFMKSLSVEKEWQEALPRITKYHMPDAKFPGKYKALSILNKLIPRSKIPGGLVPVGKSQWFTITMPCAAYIVDYLKEHRNLARFFKNSWAPDEMIFQTILNGSRFKEDMVNDNLLYADWSRGNASPKILTMADAEILERSDKLFARKFNPEIDTEILDHLDKLNRPS